MSSNQENQKPIVLDKLELNPNEFIKIKSDSEQPIEVELKEGNLNLLMEDSDSEVSIKVEDPKNVNLSIKNQVESTIIIDTAAEQNEKQNVRIKANSEIYKPLTLKVGDNNADFKTLLLSGNLGTKPKKITLTNLKDESPVKDTEYLLFEGNFENGCESWAESIDLDGNQFDEKVCKTLEDQRLQEYRCSLFVKSTGKKSDGNDDENGEENNDNKSSKGLIRMYCRCCYNCKNSCCNQKKKSTA